MYEKCHVGAFGLTVALASGVAWGQWATFENESSGRMIAESSLGANDTEEKDYAWADFDQDGDVDLVVVRKEIFSTPGRRRNVLFMNEGVIEGRDFNGVLVDRTEDFATQSSDGSQGMLDLTNDRDVVVVDVNDDGWLDFVTATAYGQGLAKTISHSRIYINLGEIGGVWQGFEYQEERMPQLQQAPDTCGVAAGDVTGDGHPDLYYTTYNSNFEDHLLVNDGFGNFTDESNRLTNQMLESGFGTHAEIVDMNSDTLLDIVKSENGPVEIFYNDGGTFSQLQSVGTGAVYFVSVGDLNDDGLMDLVFGDDGQDTYRLNLGNGGNGQANFSSQPFTYIGGGSDQGFDNNSVIVDLNNDGANDVVVTDVDVDAGGCGRRAHIFRNLGNNPSPTLQEQQIGNTVVNIPTSMLTGSHDVAAIDLNNDTYIDLVFGRCSGTQVWMNQPPVGIVFAYPGGLPVNIPPDTTSTLSVDVEAVGDANIVEGSGVLHVSVNAGPFTQSPLTEVDGVLQGTFPAAACASVISFYVSAELEGGLEFTDPPTAPAATYQAIASFGTTVAFEDDIEDDVSDWQIIDEGTSGGSGLWEAVEPLGSIHLNGLAAPEEDASFGHMKVTAFVTQNGTDPNQPSEADVDGGPYRLLTPMIDLSDGDATISYARWFYTASGVTDTLTVDISADGGDSWVNIPEHTTSGTGGEWEVIAFDVSSYVEPTAEIVVRFTTADQPNDSITEAGIDDLSVEVLDCGDTDPCPTDLTGDNTTNVQDLVELVLAWGTDDEDADINDDGIVSVEDLVAMILAWGDCE